MRAADVLAAMRSLPFAGYDAITGGGPVLLLAPHPDDESLGCGGLIAEACRLGRAITVAILTDGTGSHPNSRLYPAERLRAVREAEAREAVAVLGLPPERLLFMGLRDTASPHPGDAGFAEAAERVVARAREIGAATILTTWTHDPHGDHVSAYRLGVAAAEATGARLLAYPVWGWTLPDEAELPEPEAGFRLDVTAHLAAKRAAIAAHRSQLGQVITDDTDGFCMAEEFRALFDRPFEVFLAVDP